MSDIEDRWELRELLAVMWNPEMAQRFPNRTHFGCRQMFHEVDGQWEAFDPPKCVDWHCNRCGQSTNSYGHHDCPDRPAA